MMKFWKKQSKPKARPAPARKAVVRRTSAKGATPLQKRSFSLPTFNMASALMVLTIFVLSAVFYGSFIAVDSVLNVPVHQVEVKGELNYQPKNQVADVINNHVVDGFVSTDLKALQKELVDLPWVHKVSIHRKLPYGLSILLEEQQPVAYWNASSLINNQGELFYPVERPVIRGLPHFGGRDHEKVLDLYRELAEKLPEIQLPVRALYVNDRNEVNVVLATDTELVFSMNEHQDQLDRWIHIVKSETVARINEIKQADLRYSNGAAVVWKTSVALNHDIQLGGGQ